MATVCSFCGQELPRGGDARFCTRCGKLVPDQPSDTPNAQTSVARNDPPPANNKTPISPNLGWHEQLAKQPPVRTDQNPNATPWLGLPGGDDAGNVTPWLGLSGQDAGNATPWHGIQGQDPHFIPPALDTQRADQRAAAPGSEKEDESRKKPRDVPASDNPALRDQAQPGFYRSTRPSNPGSPRRLGASGRLSRQNSDEPPAANVVWPEPVTHVMANDEQQKNAPASAQSDFPVSSSPAKPADQAETQQDQEVEYLPTMPLTSQNPRGSAPASDAQIEDFPTSIISDPTRGTDAYVEDLPTSIISSASIAAEQSARDQRDQRERAGRRQAEDIDQMPTSQMQTNQKTNQQSNQREQRPSAAGPSPAAAPRNIDVSRPAYQQAATSRPPMTPREPISSPGNMPSVQEMPGISLAGRHFETQAAPVKPLRAPRRKKRSLLVGIIAAIVIVALAFGCWIILAQPFAVSADTNPLQTATSTPLGLTIAYPAGWTATQNSTALMLADSNNTDQMKITQSESSDSDQTGYLKQQATKLGMTNAQAGTDVSFAGSTWQQIHGDFTVSGAGYIGTIYATTHNNHLYTLIQMAPKVTFQDEESLVFAPARASLHFS